MSLMKGLSKQLSGSFEIKSDNGLTINIKFAKEQVVKFIEPTTKMQLTA